MNDLEIILKYKIILLTWCSMVHIKDICFVIRIIDSSFHLYNNDIEIIFIINEKSKEFFSFKYHENIISSLYQRIDFINSILNNKISKESLTIIQEKMLQNTSEMKTMLNKIELMFKEEVDNIQSNEEKYLIVGNYTTEEMKRYIIKELKICENVEIYESFLLNIKNKLSLIIFSESHDHNENLISVYSKVVENIEKEPKIFIRKKKSFKKESIHSSLCRKNVKSLIEKLEYG